MEIRPLDTWESGWVLARPARNGAGQPLAAAGTPLTRELAVRLQRAGLAAVAAVRRGQTLPVLPEHLDRYDDDAERRLVEAFGTGLREPVMQRLLQAAIDHATTCRNAYRGIPTPRPGTGRRTAP